MKLVLYNVEVHMSDSEIRKMIISGFKTATATGEGGTIAISGYDADTRELWQIPEVLKFAKKLVSMGVLSVLTYSTYLDPRWGPPDDHYGKPLGAFELWLMAIEQLGRGDIDSNRLMKLLDQFKVVLCDSNETAAAVVQGLVSDGNHKI